MKKSIIALTLVISMLMPMAALADEAGSCDSPGDLISWTVGLPFKVLGSALASTAGIIVGTTTGLVRGAANGTNAVAGALGDEDGAGEQLIGLALGAAPGAAIHAAVGGLTWGVKGFVQGWEKPFECASLNSALEGIPDAIEWTVDGASEAFST